MGNAALEGPTKTAKCTGADALRQSRWRPKCLYCLGKRPWRPARAKPASDVETLPAAAFALGLGILKLEGLVEALFDEVHQRAVDQRQAQGIDHDFHPPGL